MPSRPAYSGATMSGSSKPRGLPVAIPAAAMPASTMSFRTVVMFWNFFANRYWTYNDIE